MKHKNKARNLGARNEGVTLKLTLPLALNLYPLSVCSSQFASKSPARGDNMPECSELINFKKREKRKETRSEK